MVQKRLDFPGLLSECQEYLQQWNIINLENYSKGQWKNLIKTKVKLKNKDDLLHMMKQYSKIDHKEISSEHFETQPYLKQLNISYARDKFRLRSHMTRTVKFNFSSDKRFIADLWKCWHCPDIDSQAHIKICPAYQQFRDSKDLSSDYDMIAYFRQVIELRDKMSS